MSVRVATDAIHLAGRCRVEDAEALLVALQEHPGRPVHVGEAHRLHMAVVQILLAAATPIIGAPQNWPVAQFLLNSRNDNAASHL